MKFTTWRKFQLSAFMKETASEPWVFPCCFSCNRSCLEGRLICWREAWALVLVLLGNWMLSFVEGVSDLICPECIENALFSKERKSSVPNWMFHLSFSGIQDRSIHCRMVIRFKTLSFMVSNSGGRERSQTKRKSRKGGKNSPRSWKGHEQIVQIFVYREPVHTSIGETFRIYSARI